MIDIQSELQDSSTPVINKVGIKGLTLPVQAMLAKNNLQHSIATFDMAIELPSTQRATHMSRFVEILHQKSWVLSIPAIAEMLALTSAQLAADAAYISAELTVFRNKSAPVTNIPSMLDYRITFHAQQKQQLYQNFITVRVPVTCVCPCSKAISDFGAHNQRAMVEVTIETNDHTFDIDNLIATVERQGSCELYSTLKRPDEKFVTEHAYNNAKFVEDIVRDVAKQLVMMPAVKNHKIYVESFESIHNHSAYAEIF